MPSKKFIKTSANWDFKNGKKLEVTEAGKQKSSAYISDYGDVGTYGVFYSEKEKTTTTDTGKKKKHTITNLFTRNYVRNPLHDFQSYNVIFTVAALTLEEVNFPDVLYKRAPLFPVAQSAGKTGPEVTFYKDAGLNLEYFVDDVEINAVVGPSKKNKHTQFTTMTFNIKEPFSIGLFFQTLNIQAVKASGDADVNYLKAPYGLIIDFVGVDAEGKSFNNEELRKVIPFYFKSAQLRADTSGAIYECSAVPVTEYGLLTVNNAIKHDITLSGKTVYEMLQQGDQSLMGQLNFKGETDKKAKKKTKVTTVPTDDYIVYFPNNLSRTITEQQRKVITEDRAVVLADNAEYSSKFETEKRDTAVETLLGNDVIVTNEFNGTGGKGIRVFQTAEEDADSGTTFLGNEIGEAKMAIAPGNMAIIGKTFPEFEEKYDKRKKTFTRDKITLDLKKMTLSFAKGSYITDIIETVILLSEYSLNLTKNPDEIKNKPKGGHPWFRIVTKCFELKDSYIQSLIKQNPKVAVYSVVPYIVPDELFIDPGTYSEGTTQIRNNIIKGYNYLYTGLNEDILDFRLDYNFAFYNSVVPKMDKSSNTSAAGKGKTAENNATVEIEKNYEIQPRPNELKGGAGSLTNRPEDDIIAGEEGSENESIELKIARSMNKRIINSNVDLLNLDMTIIGDPYFLPSSGMMNTDEPVRTYVDRRGFRNADGSLTASGSVYGNGRGELNYVDRMCYIEVNFQTPIDVQTGGNHMIFPTTGGYVNGMNESVRLGEFSGLYRVQKIVNSFRQGKFEQTLTVIRSGNMSVDAKEGSNENKKTITETEGSN